MSFLALCKSVYRREILIYVAAPILVGGALGFWSWAEGRVAIFAVAMFLWSLYFPLRWTMDRKVVDFWYYTLGIIGVVVFFLAGGLDRERLRLRQEYETAIAKMEAAQIRHDVLRAVATDSAGVDQAMQGIAHERGQGAERSQEACQEALRLDFQKRIERRYEIDDPFSNKQDWGNFPELFDPTAICLVAAQDIQWQAIGAASTLAQRIELIVKYGLDDAFPIELGGRTGSVADFGQYLILDPASEAWKTQVEKADRDVAAAIAAANAASEAYKVLDTTISGASAWGSVDFVAKLLWPFLLITALGMKLAREAYAKKSTSTPGAAA